MKKIVLLFSLLISVAFAKSQTDASVMIFRNASMPNMFTFPYDNSFIATLPSGENIMATPMYNILGDLIINVKKIQSNGAVSTITNLVTVGGSSTQYTLKGLSCASDESFTCLFGETINLHLVKFNSVGTILWQKKINVPEIVTTYYNHSLNETPSGEYYISISEYGFMGVIKVDANGNLVWNKKLTGPRGTGKCPGFCSEVTQSGGCISTLKDDNYETIVNLAADGSLIWSRSFTDFSYRWTKSIKTDSLGNFYIMGTYGGGGTSFIQKMDSNGNLIYAKNIPGLTSFTDAFVTNSNELLLLSEDPFLELTKIGTGGSILWDIGITSISSASSVYWPNTYFSKSTSDNISFLSWMNDTTNVLFKFSGNPSEICNSYNYPIVNTSDDLQMLAAEVDSTINIDSLIVSISNTSYSNTFIEYYTSEDYCSYIASVNEATAPIDLSVYPNPATDFVNIELGNLQKADLQNAVLIIYNITGQKVFEKQMNTSSMDKFSTAEYPAGLYTIVIANSDKILAKQRVIVQK